ncbi:Abi family protein [Gordonia amicalis]|uniref:Abi family protein n=1 Tax=Gordonia amicalis TaxID=89053 RepID=UPI0022B3C4CF|nr:Abi family protein [Gordonia amicalis]MCZ4652708.1 Abi family protein [Gordonia amicalis]
MSSTMTRSLKPWLSIDDQIQRLTDRGMLIKDRAQVKHALTVVGYYRLSGYWYPYREPDPTTHGRRLDDFIEGTDFAEVQALYEFDCMFKNLLLRGIERVEVAFRSRIGHLVGEWGPLAHSESHRFRSTFDHAKWWKTAKHRIDRARGRDETVDHHDQYYGGEIPIWVLTDLLDFSDLSMLYAGMIAPDQRTIAEWFNVTAASDISKTALKNWNKNPPLTNWLEHLCIVRNICAHHGRLWNRQLTPLGIPQRVHHLSVFDDLIPTLDPKRPDLWQSERVFGTVCIINYLLNSVEPGTTWRADVDELVSRSFPAGGHRGRVEMGFPTA